MLSNSKKAEASRETMSQYISMYETKGEILPNKGGALLLSEILLETGLKRDQLSKNEGLRLLLEDYADAKGLAYSRKGRIAPDEDNRGKASSNPLDMVPVKKLRDSQQRVSQLEKRVADLRTANMALRADKLRTKAFEDLIAKGGRVAPSEEAFEEILEKISPLLPRI